MKYSFLNYLFLVLILLFTTVQGSVELKDNKKVSNILDNKLDHNKNEPKTANTASLNPNQEKIENNHSLKDAPKEPQKETPKEEQEKPNEKETQKEDPRKVLEEKPAEVIGDETMESQKSEAAPKQETSNQKTETNVPKQETTETKQETVDLKQEANDKKQESTDPTQKTTNPKPETSTPNPDSSNPNPSNEKKDSNKPNDDNNYLSTFTIVGVALVVLAVGGVTFRERAKKQIKRPSILKIKLDNNSIYDINSKSPTHSLSFSPSEFNCIREEQPRLDFFEDTFNRSFRNSCSFSNEVLCKDTKIEEPRNFNITLPTNRAYKVVLPWNARCVDEIQLNCGDLVCIKECYKDGYSLGRNLTTRFDGVFPTCCLNNIGSIVNQAEVNKWQAVGMHSLPKRSVEPTKKAKRASRGISLLSMPDWTKKLESLKLDVAASNV